MMYNTCRTSQCPAYLGSHDYELDADNCLLELTLKNRKEPNIMDDLRKAGITIKNDKKTWDDLNHKNQI